MKPGEPLEPESLYRPCDPQKLDVETSAGPSGFFGQARAVEAIEFGAEMNQPGFNLFVLGPSGTGRHSFTKAFLVQKAAGEPVPPDWCYVNNFDNPRSPIALGLPAGQGRKLRAHVDQLIEEARKAIPAALESEDYRMRREAIEEDATKEQAKAFQELDQLAREKGLGAIQTATGFAFVPLRDGKKMPIEEYRQLTEEEQQRISRNTAALGQEIQKMLHAIPRRLRRLQKKIHELDRDVALFVVSGVLQEIAEEYAELPEVVKFLKRLERDMVDHIDLFRASTEPNEPALSQILSGAVRTRTPAESNTLRRYGVNVLVDHSGSNGAPVVFAEFPAYQELVGRIEHISHMGTVMTDFNLVQAGDLHRANGGYLVVDARKVLLQPMAWEALKRALKSEEIRIRPLGHFYDLTSVATMEPAPIPLHVKIIMIGDRLIYFLLQKLDPEFFDHFKVAADFDDQMDRNSENVALLARFIAELAQQDDLLPLDGPAMARVIEQSSRVAGDSERLSTQMRKIVDLVREADFWARKGDKQITGRAEVQQAIDARARRASRLRDRLQDQILRDAILIETAGRRVGQVNGLVVYEVGDFRFGRPSRISARVSLGSGEVVDIEREVDLGGPIHSKGVLILSSLLASNYVKDRPLSLSARLVFEQSYGEVDGDSASVAELCALLSAVSEVPLSQALAVTGSINQHGEVQPVGAINEKIEGFFDICNARELRGDQGVIIPWSNVRNLMLRSDVVEAVAAQKFHVYPVQTLDQCTELLTGLSAGEPDEQGNFPDGSFNGRIRGRLIELAENRRQFTSATTENGSA